MLHRSNPEKITMIVSRLQLKVSTRMLDAGVRALDTCREVGGHTARTVCQAVFSAMLAESEWSPAIRKRPEKFTPQRMHDPAERIDYYRGQLLGSYEWQGFNRQDGLHYFRDTSSFPHKWIRLSDRQWDAKDLADCIRQGLYYVSSRTAMQYLKRKSLTLS